MNTISPLEHSRTYHDLNSLAGLRGQGDSREAMKEAAQQFESVFYGMMIKSMRDATDAINEDKLFGSAGTELFQDMYDKQLSLSIGSGDGSHVGLADIMLQQLTGTNGQTEKSESEAEVSKQEWRQFSGSVHPVSISVKNNTDRARLEEREPTVQVGQVDGVQSLVAEQDIEHKGIDFSSPQAFVKTLMPYAEKFASKLALDPALMIAQAALETGWGKFVMRTVDGLSSNNLFGIKAGNDWSGSAASAKTLEFQDGDLRQVRANFRAYEHPEQAFADYVDFLQSRPRYQKALDASGEARRYLDELQAAGYATDPDYADKIHRIYQSDTLNDAIQQVTTDLGVR